MVNLEIINHSPWLLKVIKFKNADFWKPVDADSSQLCLPIAQQAVDDLYIDYYIDIYLYINMEVS